MGRKSKNIKIELNRRIDELLRIGEKKVKDDKDNPNRAEGIHSIRTADTYRSIANSFADFLKGQGVRSMAEMERQHIEDYMLSRSDLSAYTHSRDLSAINKLLDTRYIPRDFGFQDRKYSHITNNRGTALYGFDVKAISEHLGHCNTAITSDIYTHIFKEYKAKMAESIENVLI